MVAHSNLLHHAQGLAQGLMHGQAHGGNNNKNKSLSDFISDLWHADVNRFAAMRDFVIDIQDGKSMHQRHDAAAKPLFESVDKNKFMRVPTFANFYALLDNYVDETGIAEQVTAEEKLEEMKFIQAVVATDIAKAVFSYVNAKGWWRGSTAEWVLYLRKLWFTLYRRESMNDSSAFEHVFVGEIRNGQVIGFHNWVTIFLAERKKVLDYRGYIFPRRRHACQPSNDTHLLKLQFTYKGKLKPISTVLLGVSPEFELMLYTLVFLSGQDSVACVLDDTDVSVIVHRNKQRGTESIGSAYIDILE
ncbi:hypothetical protein H9P43_005593 [Blastocladiella emersonii ATCC 22665]|nr:hypothetical protein H9P43_005593 [Blastocladiella emersonii ATCC 22665]